MTVLFLSFQFGILFISFSSLIAVARTSNNMLNNSGDSGHPCLVSDLVSDLLILVCNFFFCSISVWFWYQGDGRLLE